MIRKLILVLALLVALVPVSCTCAAEKGGARVVDEKAEKLGAKYLKYVEADPKLSEKEKDDERKFVQALKFATTSLVNSLDK